MNRSSSGKYETPNTESVVLVVSWAGLLPSMGIAKALKIPVSSLVSFDEKPALQSITRRNRERAITVYANVAPGHSQDEAIANRAGMWAHGVPGYVMTSAHSFDEDTSREFHYNRLVSTRDGHSESVRHRETYSECEWVCADEIVADPTASEGLARSLRADPVTAPLVADLSNLILLEVVTRYARIGTVPEYFTGPAHDPVLARLDAARAAGALPPTTTTRGSCFLYVAFERRYGLRRAECLRDHGTLPPGVDDIWHLGDH